MNREERIAEIFRQLQEIAETTVGMSISGTANAGYKPFDNLMARHKKLTDEAMAILVK